MNLKSERTIGEFQFRVTLQQIGGSAYVSAHRPLYQLVPELALTDFLFKTKVDRNRWRQADPTRNVPELVCTSFRVLMVGLLEQQRLIDGCLHPLAVAGCGGSGAVGGHSLIVFLTEAGQVRFLNADTDELLNMGGFVARYGTDFQFEEFIAQ